MSGAGAAGVAGVPGGPEHGAGRRRARLRGLLHGQRLLQERLPRHHPRRRPRPRLPPRPPHPRHAAPRQALRGHQSPKSHPPLLRLPHPLLCRLLLRGWPHPLPISTRLQPLLTSFSPQLLPLVASFPGPGGISLLTIRRHTSSPLQRCHTILSVTFQFPLAIYLPMIGTMFRPRMFGLVLLAVYLISAGSAWACCANKCD